MGDRANFGFVQPNGETIVLYGHWAGHQMLGRLADAVIAARPRWNDPAYATRIAVSQLIKDAITLRISLILRPGIVGSSD